MPPKTWDEIIAIADAEAKETFISEASSLVRLTNEEIENIVPQEVEYKKFAELMKVVHDATMSNREKAESLRTISGFAEIAVNILSKFV
jgi:hypothetical protein